MNEPRTVGYSKSDYGELALPIYANPLGKLIGGRVMHLVDMAGAIAAMRHCGHAVVTASIDQMSFLRPINIGELVVLKSSVNRAFHTSMEVGVMVCAENPRTGAVRHTSSAYLTFVALDENGQRVPVPPVIPETEEEKRRYAEAAIRRELRLQMKDKSLKKELRNVKA
jgi:acyl-CoA hydrolase